MHHAESIMPEPDAVLVSVIIPVYNDAERLGMCVAAVQNQEGIAPGEVEILVVDNGSTPPVAETLGEVAAADPRVRILVEETPGSYAARNHGLTVARGRYLAFTDSDCRPEPTWLAEGVAAMKEAGEKGVVGGLVRLVPKRAGRPNLLECFDMAANLDQEWVVRVLGSVITANVITTRATIDAVGPFDATMKTGGDIDFGRRVREAGYPVRFSDSAVVNHPARGTISELSAKMRRFAGGRRQTHPLWMYLLHTPRLIFLPSTRHWKRIRRSPRIAGFSQRAKAMVGSQLARWLEAWHRIGVLLGRPPLR